MKDRDAALRVDCRNELGEMPLWCGESATLHWIDVVTPGRVFHWSVETGEIDFYSFDHLVTGLSLVNGGDLLVHGATDLLRFNPPTGRSRHVWSLPRSSHRMRLNDGHCDQAGRLWIGTMSDNIGGNGKPPEVIRNVGQICAIGPGSCRQFDTRLGCPNAICWSPDGRTFYVADSCDGWVYAYEFDLPSATISAPRPFYHAEGLGIPDGAAVDEDGYFWNARWGAGAVVRISPGGTLSEIVRVPVSQPTACCFGGADRRTLYISSARFALPSERLAVEPFAGGIFAVRTDVPGLALPSFEPHDVLAAR